MSFELWDTETRNLVEVFEVLTDGLAAVRELVSLNPGIYPAALALAYEDAQGETRLVARGQELAHQAGTTLGTT